MNAWCVGLYVVLRAPTYTQLPVQPSTGLLLAVIYAAHISFSRLYLAVHSPLDVVG